MTTGYLASGVLMGAFLLLVVVVMLRLRSWRRVTPSLEAGRAALGRLAESPAAWTAVFVGVVFGVTAVAILYVSTAEEQAGAGVAPGLLEGLLLGAFGLLVSTLVFAGVYSTVRSRGGASSMAVGVSSGVLGFLFLAVLAFKLILA